MIEEKRVLRKKMHDLRCACADRSALDSDIAEHFLESEIYQKAQALLLYASFGAEADTYAILLKALQDGKAVYLPRCTAESNIMQFYRIFSPDELKRGTFGIPAPEENEDRLFLEGSNAVCVVPGLAFSVYGERLGYGRGYYDTFLEKIDVCTVGFCYSFQVVERIPTEQHDKRMRYLCTENGLIRCGDQCAWI